MTIHEQFRNAINKDGRTGYALAQASGIDASVLSRFMRGERGLNLDTAERLCQVLGVEVRLVKVNRKH